MNTKTVRICKFDGESYRCMGSSGITGIRLELEFRIPGSTELGRAKLDGFFRGYLGDLTKAKRDAIKLTMPNEVNLFTRSHEDPFGNKSMIYVIRKPVLAEWLARVKQVLTQSVSPDQR